jgi:enoyl-CoA hydratase/carnithine racemase
VGESLRLRLPFASLGLVPEWGSSYMLQANIGAQRAAELFYTAEWVDANKALDCGIAAAVLPDHDLFEHAYSKAREIAQWPVKSLREIKRSLRIHHLPALDTAINAEQAGMERQAGSPENIEAITAFMEKRPPDFSKV